MCDGELAARVVALRRQPADLLPQGAVLALQLRELALQLLGLAGAAGDVYDVQRRLRWALDGLPDGVRDALPQVDQLANAEWVEFMNVEGPEEMERDIREEMRSV